MKTRVYLDHHATTPLAPMAREAMLRAMAAGPGNPSSPHADGRRARTMLETARRQVSEAVGAAPRELVFTSGGTEAVDAAVVGVGEAAEARAVWCDPGAHPCLRAACEGLAWARGVALRYIPTVPGAGGLHDLAALDAALGAEPRGTLVAVSVVQHETGGVADLAALSRVCNGRGALLVLDAVQALGKVALDLQGSGAVAAALSAHKLGGPAGVGALWLAAGVGIRQRVRGGGQERGVRAGTENLLGAVGFGAAATQAAVRRAAMPAVGALRDRIVAQLVALGATVNDDHRPRVDTVAHASWEGLAAQELVAALDLEGFSVSAGAACSSGKVEPSESVLRMYPEAPWRASGALRVSLGPDTTGAEVGAFCEALARVLPRFAEGA